MHNAHFMPLADFSHEPMSTRVVILEAALDAIHRECERALDEPSVVFMSMCRVAALTRQALRDPRAA
jgi:hypothetical protein